MLVGRLGWLFVVAIGAVCAVSVGAGARPTSTGRVVFAADRLPDWYGEVVRVDLDGRRIDLSRSPAQDVGPAVSPDGKQVAFASNRDGLVALYVVGVDGTGLRRVTPALFSSAGTVGFEALLAWSPDGKRIAAVLNAPGHSFLWVGDLSRHGRVVARGAVVDPVWAPDGRALAYEPGDNEVDVISTAGKALWHVLGDAYSAAWSRRGLLAVRFHGETIRVYRENGRLLGSAPGEDFAWSPDGTRIASVVHGRLQLRARGLGAPSVDLRVLPGKTTGEVQWLAGDRLRVNGAAGWVGVDVAAGRTFKLPPAFRGFDYPPTVSADGRELAVTGYHGLNAPVTLSVATLDGGTGPVLQQVPYCGDATVFSSLQFARGGRSLVYQSGCIAPSGDIYSMPADGGELVQLTATPTDEMQPAVSPDGTQIAYVQQTVANRCKGCPLTIWQMNADGSEQRALTQPAPNDDAWDNRPTWSPDGSAILFWHSTISSFGYLVELPSGGGTQRRLPVAGGYPAWGPSRIAYLTTTNQIRTALPDGTDVRTITTDRDLLPATLSWSSDGRLAFLEVTGAKGLLRLVVVHGATLTRHALGGLTTAAGRSGLAWSPDGTRLAFTAADAVGTSDVYTIGADGTGLQQVTHDLDALGPLSWTR